MGEIIVILKFSKVYKDIFRERNNTFFYYSSGELESGIERTNKITITSLAYFLYLVIDTVFSSNYLRKILFRLK